MMFNLTLDSILFWGINVALFFMNITVLIEAYKVLFVEKCVKHRTRSLVLFWCSTFIMANWIMVIFSEPEVQKTSTLCLLGIFILLWPISNRHNLVSKNAKLNNNGS